MEYQRTINFLNNTPNQQTKFRRKNWLQTNHESRGKYNTNNQNKFKTLILGYFYVFIVVHIYLLKELQQFQNTAAAGAPTNNTSKKFMFKNSVSFTSCISRICTAQIGDPQYIDVVTPVYNLIEYSDNYWKKREILFQYCKDVLIVDIRKM